MPDEPIDPFDRIRRRLDAAGIEYRDDVSFAEEPALRISMPSGRTTRGLLLDTDDGKDFEAIGFESIRFLEGLTAIINGDDAMIEARVRSVGRFPMRVLLGRVPGARPISVPTVRTDDDEVDEPSRVTGYEVRVDKSAEEWVSLSPVSAALRTVASAPASVAYSLKIPCDPNISHDDALDLLNSVAHSFLFDLDLRYGLPLDLVPHRPARQRPRTETVTEPPTFPVNAYAPEPLALYRYGRSAQGLPLLEFLAYYQAIEFFFPYFSSFSLIGAVRTELLDPRFNAADDTALARIISLSRPASRSTVSERDQLRATLVACSDVAWITAAITADAQTRDHFCANKQALSSVKKIQVGGEVDIRHQVADRIYDIRCRIVHAKQDGGDSGVDLLLPSGDEAAALGPDIDLTRAIAQRVIIARAQRLT